MSFWRFASSSGFSFNSDRAVSANSILSAYLPASNEAADKFDNGDGSDGASFAASVYAAMANEVVGQHIVCRS